MTLYKNEYPVIDSADPWSADRLQRKSIADKLTPIVRTISQPFVIGIESPYGTGKSVFLDCWAADLNNAGYKAFKFNAWESDFSHDPLAALMSCLKRNLPDKKAKKAAGATIEAGKRIMRAAATKAPGILAKAVIHKALGSDAAAEMLSIGDLEAGDVADLGKAAIDEALDAQEKAEAGLSEFRKSLQEWVASASAPAGANVRVIILVDELDRCRPAYAIQVLECIKHLFTIPGVVFVLAVDWLSLCSAVAGAYGSSIDADRYLRKFIDWRYKLPAPKASLFAEFLAQRFSLHDIANANPMIKHPEIDDAIKTFGHVASALQLTLREQEQAFTQFNLAVRGAVAGTAPLLRETAFFAAYCIRHRSEVEASIAGKYNSGEAGRKIWEDLGSKQIFESKETDLALIHSWFVTEKEIEETSRRYQSAPPSNEIARTTQTVMRFASNYLHRLNVPICLADGVIGRLDLV